MRRLWRLFLILSAVLAILFAGLVIERPGPHRVVAAEAFGLTRIAPGIHTDAPHRRAELLALIDRVEARSAALFETTSRRPRMVLCTTAECRDAFGLTGNALTIANLWVLAAPDGVNADTLLHERIHVELHARMGLLDAWRPRFPSWFNEGLATWLSGSPVRPPPGDPRDADWVRAADTPLAWRRMRQGRDPWEYYGASALLVQEIESRIGRDGLMAMVERVGGGAPFDAEYARALGR